MISKILKPHHHNVHLINNIHLNFNLDMKVTISVGSVIIIHIIIINNINKNFFVNPLLKYVIIIYHVY